MLDSHCSWGWAILALQLLGLCSVLLTRFPIPHRAGLGTFLACLLAVGGATFFALSQGSSCWVPWGTTFSLMVVGAIFQSPSTTLHAI